MDCRPETPCATSCSRSASFTIGRYTFLKRWSITKSTTNWKLDTEINFQIVENVLYCTHGQNNTDRLLWGSRDDRRARMDTFTALQKALHRKWNERTSEGKPKKLRSFEKKWEALRKFEKKICAILYTCYQAPPPPAHLLDNTSPPPRTQPAAHSTQQDKLAENSTKQDETAQNSTF